MVCIRLTPLQTLFAVPLSCDGCIKDVSEVLHKVPGISKVEGNLEEQLLSIEGTGILLPALRFSCVALIYTGVHDESFF